MLMQARDDDGIGMSDEQLRDEVMTISCRYETTANALSWTFYLLARHPEAEEKLADELGRVLEGNAPAFHHFPHLHFTQSVIKESMRLYPPVWWISREPKEDVWLDDYFLPAGCDIALSQWVMHRRPEYFTEPASFIPDRWNRKFEESLPSYVYFPFGAGPRICIGNNFAMMEAVLLLAAIMQQFHFDLDISSSVVIEPSITLRPEQGIYVVINKR